MLKNLLNVAHLTAILNIQTYATDKKISPNNTANPNFRTATKFETSNCLIKEIFVSSTNPKNTCIRLYLVVYKQAKQHELNQTTTPLTNCLN